MKIKPPTLLPKKGERTLSVGQTGSGKSVFNVWALKRSESSPIVIYDTKIEPKFLTLPFSVLASSWQEVMRYIGEGTADYIVFRPSVHLIADRPALDSFLFAHITRLPGIDAYIDEGYNFHSHGYAGPGITGMITQGRSRGISFSMSTQRPVLISKFAITEAQHIYAFVLAHSDDIKTLEKRIPGYADATPVRPGSFKFYHYHDASQTLTLYNPVRLDEGVKQEYTDTNEIEPDADKLRFLTWI